MSTGNTFGRPLVIRDASGDEVWIESGLGSPNGVLTRPKGSIYYRTTPAQQWQNTNGGTAWTQIASGSMGAHFATDTFIYFGDSDNYQIGYVSDIVPYLSVTLPVPAYPGWLISSILVDNTPGPGLSSALAIGTQSTFATGAGVTGKVSGYLIYSTGDTRAEDLAQGGDVGGVLFAGGKALGSSVGTGTSGNTLEFTWETGPSDDGSTGGLKFISGNGKTASGGFEFRAGDVQGAGLPGGFLFNGNRDPDAGGLTSTMEMQNISLTSKGVTQADSVTTPVLVKIFSFPLGTEPPQVVKINLGTLGASTKAYIIGVRAVKTGNVGGLLAQVQVTTSTAPFTVTTLSLVGVAVGTAVEGGQTGAAFDPAAAILNSGDSFTVDTSGTNCECVVYVTYAQG